MKRKGIIDIGTNTFNLLVVEFTDDNSYMVIHEEKLPVKLGKGSMKDKILKPDAMDRAVKAINKHLETAKKYNIKRVDAIATSAVRGAINKNVFLNMVKGNTGLDIKVISGDEEAFFIYHGVKQAVQMEEGIGYLILDIGGGSNEFIICDKEKMRWRNSYDLGIARMLEQISPSDPITEEDMKMLIDTTNNMIGGLVDECSKYKPKVLIGASGSFETYLSMIMCEKKNSDKQMKKSASFEIPLDDFNKLYKKLVHSSLDERLRMPGLPSWRANMIVMAAVFTQYIIDKFKLQKIIFSDYALKEGIVAASREDNAEK